jgi:cell division protease FtsH
MPIDDIDEVVADLEEEADLSSSLRDPAAVAAEVMIDNMLSRRPDIEVAVKTDAAVFIIRTPSIDWNDDLCEVWLKRFYNANHFKDRLHRPTVVKGSPKSVSRSGSERHSSREAALKEFAESVWQGKIILAFSPTPEKDFPPEYITYGDYSFEIPKFNHEDVPEVAARLCGSDPEQQVFSGDVDLVKPLTLQLAYRPGRSADAYLQRLTKICSKTTSAIAVASPREAPTLHRLHGMPDVVEWGLKLAADIADYKAGRLPWSAIDNGLLVSGPPGVGKSLFARALATSCDVPLILASHSLWQSAGEAHLGTTLKAMRGSFADAKARVPSILFIDEIDSFPDRRTLKHAQADYSVQVVNGLLAEMDGADTRTGVVVVAACNYPNKLDPALVRSGRLDRHVQIELPDAAALQQILREHLGEDLPGQDLTAEGLLAEGASGADCERIVRGARSRARSAGRAMVAKDLIDEICGVDDRPNRTIYQTAIHEAGHAYAFAKLLPGRLQSVSVRRQGNAGGGVRAGSERGVLSPEKVKDLLRIQLSGRAAEQVLLGTATSGAGGGSDSDLAQATKLAAHAAASFGFSKAMGLCWLGEPGGPELPRSLMANPQLAQAVRLQLDDAYASALALMEQGRLAVTVMAKVLVKRRVLGAQEVAQIIEEADVSASRQYLLDLNSGRCAEGVDAVGG